MGRMKDLIIDAMEANIPPEELPEDYQEWLDSLGTDDVEIDEGWIKEHVGDKETF